MEALLINFLKALLYASIAIGAMYGFKRFRNAFILTNADYLIEEQNNLAVAFRQSGIYLGIAIAMFAVFSGKSLGFWKDIEFLLYYGFLSVVLISISLWINNKVILPGVDNTEELRRGNIAVGLTEVGGIIATGIIAMASFSGTGTFLSAIVFFVLGQVSLICLIILYEWITPFKVIKNIKIGNVSAGVLLALMQIAFAIILLGSIKGDFTGWSTDLLAFGKSALSGLILIVLLFNRVVDQLFLTGTDVHTEIERDQNSAAMLVVGTVKVSLALIISGVVL